MGRQKSGGGLQGLMVILAILVAVVAVGIWVLMTDVEPDAPEAGGGDVAEAGGDATADGPARPGGTGPVKRPPKPGTAGPVLAGFGSLRGEVRFYKGKTPAPGIVLSLKQAEAPAETAPLTATTGPDGSFSFTKVPAGGGWELRGASAGFAPIELTGVDVAPDQSLDVGVLWLAIPVSASLEIVDDRGAAVADADVSAFTQSRPGGDNEWSDEERESRVLSLVSNPRPNKSGKTGKDGKVTIDGLMPGTYRFVASAAGRANGSRYGVLLMPDAAPVKIRIVLGPGHELTGTVFDEKGAPVPGVRMIAVRGNDWMPGRDKWFADTGPDGTYRLESLAAGPMSLYLQRPGMPVLSVGTAGIPDTTRFDVRLTPSGSITGTVTGDDGKPVAGAVIVMAMQNTWTPMSTKTGADGTYSLLNLPAGPLGSFRVEAQGFVPYPDPSANQQGAGESLRAGAVMVRDVVLRRGRSAEVRVTSDTGAPIEGANVALHMQRMWGGEVRPWTAVTDKEGRCKLTGLLTGEYLVMIRADGWVQPNFPVWWQNLVNGGGGDAIPAAWRVSIKPEADAKRDFKLTKGGVVRGRVLDSRGEPFAGASVGVSGARSGDPVFTDGEGKFEVTAVPPVLRATAWASAPGKGGGSSEPFIVKAEAPTENIEIRLGEGGRITGTVKTRDGTPMTGVMVRWLPGQYDPNDQWSSQQFDGAERHPVGPDGRFELTDVSPGQITVRADAEGALPGTRNDVVVTAGQETGGVDLLLGTPREIRGRVEAQAGGPVAGATVSCQYQGNAQRRRWGFAPGLAGQPMAQTDGNGEFVLKGLEDGNYQVWAQAPGFAAGAVVQTQTGAGEIRIQLALGKTIAGIVKDVEGKPVGGVPVNPERVGNDGQQNWYYWGGWGLVYSGPDGTFEIKDLPDGGYNLKVSGSWNWSRELNVEDTMVQGVPAGRTDVEIVVKQGGVIEGRLLDKEDKPVRTGWVYGNFESGTGGWDWANQRYVQVRPDGTFRLAGLKPGQWTITAYGSFQSQPARGVSVNTTDVTIRVEAGFAIAGQVIDERGLSAESGVGIQVRKAGAQNWEWKNIVQPGDGKFMITGLTEGAWDLLVSTDGAAPLQIPNVAAGTLDLVVTPKKGLEITGYVVDGSGSPVKEAQVQASQVNVPAGAVAGDGWAQTDEQGRFRMAGLAEGEYRVFVRGSQLAPGIAVVPAGSLDVRFVLTPGTTITGTVTDAAGAGIANARLSFTSEDGIQITSTRTDAAGKFTLSYLPEGMRGRIGGWQNVNGQRTEIKHDAVVEAGASDVKIEVK